MTPYSMPFNKAPYISDFRRYLAEIFLHSLKFRLSHIRRRKTFLSKETQNISLCKKTLSHALSVKKPRPARLWFWGEGCWERGGGN